MQLAGLLEEAGRRRLGRRTQGSESCFSGNEIAPCNNEGAAFLTFCVSVHSIAHIVLAPGGNLTSEKAELKWVWVEILQYFTGLRESSRTFFRHTFPVGPFLPSQEQEIGAAPSCPLGSG